MDERKQKRDGREVKGKGKEKVVQIISLSKTILPHRVVTNMKSKRYTWQSTADIDLLIQISLDWYLIQMDVRTAKTFVCVCVNSHKNKKLKLFYIFKCRNNYM